MRKIIFGTGRFSERLYNLIDGENDVEAFCVDRSFVNGKNWLNKPLIAYEDLEDYFKPEFTEIFFCIGYKKMNKIRKKRIDDAMNRGFLIGEYCHPTASVEAVHRGVGNIFMEHVIIGDNVSIGNGNIFWPASHIAHDTKIGNYNFFAISSVVSGNVTIEDFCMIGANSTIKDGIGVAEGTLVGAGSYISKSTTPWSVYVPPRSRRLEMKSSMDFI